MDIRDLFIAQDNGSSARPPVAERGVVTAVNGDGTLYVNCSGVGERMAVTDSIGSPVVGNTVVVLRTPQGPVAAMRIAPPSGLPTPPIEAPDARIERGLTYISPIRSYSFELPDWQDPVHGTSAWSEETRLRQGTDTSGLAWRSRLYYSTVGSVIGAQAPAEAVLSGVNVTGAQVRVARALGGPASAIMTKLTLTNGGYWPPQAGDGWGPSVPVALPDWDYIDVTWVTPKPTTLTVDVALLPGQAKWVDLPADWWPALIAPLVFTADADSYSVKIWCGLGLYGTTPTPEFIGPSIDQDPEQGLLRIDWTA